jgi:mannose-6-phosphate isomerase-like protein (cupin superfamily)
MRGYGGYVVAERDVRETTGDDGDTARTRFTIGPSQGCERLEQRLVRFGPGRSNARELGDLQAVLYVVAGNGRLHVGDGADALRPLTGAYVAAGESFAVENAGDDDLVVVLVTAPVEHSTAPLDGRIVHWAERESLPASPNREFRLLVNEDVGCRDVTQFVGVIPPGRAPMHSHTYDEVIYVLDGDGVLHLAGAETPIEAGTCIHLPPLVEHCLENRGAEPMRVLGVFHPAGSPASRAAEERI